MAAKDIKEVVVDVGVNELVLKVVVDDAVTILKIKFL
jgi:hypothetical protein